jgi:hypothetical protein
MNWRTRIAVSVAASWLAVTMVGAAEAPEQKAAAKPVAAASKDGAGEKSRKKDQKCTQTGSRIPRDSPADCERSAPGQTSYTAEELARTGEMDISDALRKIDPRFR